MKTAMIAENTCRGHLTIKVKKKAPPKNKIFKGVGSLHFYCQRLPNAFSAITTYFMSYRVTMFWIPDGQGLGSRGMVFLAFNFLNLP